MRRNRVHRPATGSEWRHSVRPVIFHRAPASGARAFRNAALRLPAAAAAALMVSGVVLAPPFARAQEDPLHRADLAPVEALSRPHHEPVPLAREGRAEAVVYAAPPVAGHQRGRAFETMLRELLEVIELSTGAKLAMVEEPPAPEQPAVIIGDCAEARAAGIAADTLPYEGFVVKTAPNRIFLVGSTRELPYAREREALGDSWPPRYANEGDAWAMADFLERFVGVRWYWPTEALGRSIVETDSLVIPPVHYGDAPVFRFRYDYAGYRQAIENGVLGVSRSHIDSEPVAVALPVPGEVKRLAPPLLQLREGSSWPYFISVHTLPVGPQQGFYSMSTPLCSPELIAYMLAGAEDYWDRGGRRRPWITPDAIHVSYWDFPVRGEHVAGECLSLVGGADAFDPRVAAAVERMEVIRPAYLLRTWGRSSHVMGMTVKKLAEEVARRWPDKKVIYLPYWDYTLAPDIDFPENLEVILGLTHTDGMAGMAEPDKRAVNDANIEAWSEKAGGRITLWDWPAWGLTQTFAPVQFPGLIRDFYRQHRERLAGTFLDTPSLVNWTKGAPTMYAWMRLLWNPDADVDAILDEWCRRMFGPAAETTRELLRLMCDRWETAPWGAALIADAGLSPCGRIFSNKWPPAVTGEMDKLRRRALAEMRDDETARKRFQYWQGDALWAAFLREADFAWQTAGLTPRKPRISSFRFAALEPPAEGEVIENIGGFHRLGYARHPFGREIRVTVPLGTDLAALRPDLTHTGDDVRPEPGSILDFSHPVTFTVVSAEGTAAEYEVRVRYKTELVRVEAASVGVAYRDEGVEGRLDAGTNLDLRGRAYGYISFEIPETSGRIRQATLNLYYRRWHHNPSAGIDAGYLPADDWDRSGFAGGPEPEETMRIGTGDFDSWREADITRWLEKEGRGPGRPLVLRLAARGGGNRDARFGAQDEHGPFLILEIEYDTVEARDADRARFRDAVMDG